MVTVVDGRAGAGRWPALDGLRGVAIAMVLTYHLAVPVADRGGWGLLGVELFFVLSGFLITALLLNERSATGEVSFRRFFARRALRLFPALLAVLAATVVIGGVLAPHGGQRSASLWGALGALFYVSDLTSAFHRVNELNPLALTWSLSIEEHFYLLWPVSLLALLRWRGKQAALAVALGLVALGTIERLLLWRTGASFDRLYYAPDTRAAGLLLGCALALTLDLRPAFLARSRGLLMVLGLAVLGLSAMVTLSPSTVAVVLPIGSLAAAFAVLGAVGGAPGWVRSCLAIKPLVVLGKVSYGLYLWHWVIMAFVHFYAPTMARPARVSIEVVLFAVVTALSWRFIEQPALRQRHRFASIPTSDAALAA